MKRQSPRTPFPRCPGTQRLGGSGSRASEPPRRSCFGNVRDRSARTPPDTLSGCPAGMRARMGRNRGRGPEPARADQFAGRLAERGVNSKVLGLAPANQVQPGPSPHRPRSLSRRFLVGPARPATDPQTCRRRFRQRSGSSIWAFGPSSARPLTKRVSTPAARLFAAAGRSRTPPDGKAIGWPMSPVQPGRSPLRVGVGTPGRLLFAPVSLESDGQPVLRVFEPGQSGWSPARRRHHLPRLPYQAGSPCSYASARKNKTTALNGRSQESMRLRAGE